MHARSVCALALSTTLVALAAGAGAEPSAAQEDGTSAASAAHPLPLPGRDPARWNLRHASEFKSARSTFKTWLTMRDDWIKGDVPYSNLEGAPYRTRNASVAGGNLQLRVSHNPLSRVHLTTASVNARGRVSFKYGYLEARILVPSCAGCWPAFWLLPHAKHWPPEIDVFEYFNTAAMPYPYSAVHWPAKNPKKKEHYSSKVLSPRHAGDYTGGWHTYGMLWDSKRVRIYMDGRPGATFTKRGTIPQKAMYPIIQLAVGRGHMPADGSTMLVDYLRLWQRRR